MLSLRNIDGTLGDVTSGYHTVVLQGTGTVNSVTGTWTSSDIRSGLTDWLQQNGFGVVSMSVVPNNGWNPLDNTFAIAIEVNALNENSAEWVRQNVEALCQQWSSWGSANIYNLQLAVVSDSGITIDGGDLGTVTVNTNDGVTNAGAASQANALLHPPAGGSSAALNSFAQGLGVTAPVVLLAGGVLLVLMLKK